MRNLRDLRIFVFIIGYSLTVYANVGVNRPQPFVVYPSVPGQTGTNPDKPTLVIPKPGCDLKFINGRRVIHDTTNQAECAKRAYDKAQQKKQAAINAAIQTMKIVESQPSKAEECIRTVNTASQECLRQKVQRTAQTKPRFLVGSNSNKVVIYDKGKKIFIAVRIQSHYTKKPDTPKQIREVNKYKDVYVFNELGHIIATKQAKQKKKNECICPVPGSPMFPNTTEKITSDCIKTDCSPNNLITNILNNATIEQSGDNDASKKNQTAKEQPAAETKK